METNEKEYQKMEKGVVYSAHILEIRENIKWFNGKKGKVYRHDIIFRDTKTKKMHIGEFLSDYEVIRDEIVLGAYQNLQCSNATTMGDTIIPCVLEVCERPATREPKTPDFHDLPRTADKSKSVNVSGLSTTFAHAYAKDILVAEMSRWHPARPVTPEDIARMNLNAEMINASIVSSIIF